MNRLFAIVIAFSILFGGCYAGGIGRWKNLPQTPVPEHCKGVMNPCNEPWEYPPLHD